MEEEKFSKDISSILLITFIAITLIASICCGVIQSTVDNWFQNRTVVVIITCFHIIRTVSFILPTSKLQLMPATALVLYACPLSMLYGKKQR